MEATEIRMVVVLRLTLNFKLGTVADAHVYVRLSAVLPVEVTIQ